MKKLFLYLTMALTGLCLASCEGPQGPVGPRGAKGEPGSVNMKTYTYRVNFEDWNEFVPEGADPDAVQYYYYDIVDEDMNVYLNQKGVVMVYRYVDNKCQKPLPDEQYCIKNGDIWQEQFDFDVYEPNDNELGSVRIYWTINDYVYEGAPDTQVFRVVLIWP